MLTLQRALVRMPEVIGLPLGKARLLVENAGLVIEAVTFAESYEARDTVLQQRPGRGQMIHAGDKVTLVISRESYVKWLPSVYQRADLNGQNFFRDFLWIIQHLFGSVEGILDSIHTYFDPYEAPEEFLPWLASWSAMVLEEDWPLAKKRRLIRKAIELYRIRGTVRGIKLFIALFTGHEPEIRENVWPFRGWRIGTTSAVGIDTIVLPPVNLAHTFIVEMPVSYRDLSPEAVIRIHEIIQLEKPANTQYYLQFAAEEERPGELNEFLIVGGQGAIGIGAEAAGGITSEAELEAMEESASTEDKVAVAPPSDDALLSPSRSQAPLSKAPRADLAPVEGREGPRSSKAGGFEDAGRQMAPISATELMASQWAVGSDAPPDPSGPAGAAGTESKKTKSSGPKRAQVTRIPPSDDQNDPEKK